MCKTYYDSISSDIVNTIKWIDCASRLKYEVLILMFNFVHNMCPEYFLNYFDLVSIPDHNTRNSKYFFNQSLSNSASSRYFYNYTFRVLGYKYWKKLDPSFTDEQSFNVYKKKVCLKVLDEQSNALNNQQINNYCNVCDYSCIDDVVNSLR